ncbi:hypothetical protein OHA25_60880 (plasmid) [Nonomuraea sp. NBC_00507]|uniref:hypothetical protein n=1 Tax=Nonomuraea sp. NBC_00507 TaxID=2976002 RepID=UPI002E1946A5
MDVNKLLADLVRDVEREDARFAAYSPPDRGAAARAAYKTALGRVLAAVEGVYGQEHHEALNRGLGYLRRR